MTDAEVSVPRDVAGRETDPPAWAGEANLASVGLVARLLRIHLLFAALLDDVMTSAEQLTVADYLVLALADRSEGPSSPSRIARILRRSTGGMTLTLDRLEARGWLTRTADPSDRRRVQLALTPAGRATVAQVRSALHAWEDGLELRDDERPAATDAADLLIDLLSGPEPAASGPG